MIPDQYQNGLYKIDLTVKNISFILFIAMSYAGELFVIVLKEANRAFYIPTIGLTILLVDVCFTRTSKQTVKTDFFVLTMQS